MRSSVVLAALLCASCGADMAMSSGGEFGATQGGVQDMKLAREYVANGTVPPAEAFVVEGMFSEHDLPVAGAPCERTLCLRGAGGVAPTLDGEPAGWVQVGLSSTINPETFRRPTLTAIFTVDVSASMGWNYSNEENSYPTPGSLSRKLMHVIADQLGEGDQVAIVAYGSDSEIVLPLTSAADKVTISNAIERLSEDGSTNMEAGLADAYGIGRLVTGPAGALASARRTEQVRTFLFTDAQPNVGATSAGSFEQIARDGAARGIGLTVFCMGIGMGQEVIDGISHLRGGNAFSLFKLDDVGTLMEESWPWLASPIAYDLKVELTAPDGLSVMEGYGFPNRDGDVSSKLEASTVFLSRKRGALLVRLGSHSGGEVGPFLVSGRLSYQATSGEQVSEEISAGWSGDPARDDRGQAFAQASTSKTVALAVMVSGMRRAASIYAGEHASAVEVMRKVVTRAEQDAAALADTDFDPELKLSRDLLALMENGAPQTSLYGGNQ
jgi:Ca-activated chloride channel family protein